jgi:hypothetical protein
MYQKIDFKTAWLWVFCCLALLSARAQNEISTPYSSYGIGTVIRTSNGVLDAMGGTSYAMQSPYYINFRNPASYAAFDSLSFIADVGASVFSSRLHQGDLSQQNTYAKPNYLTIGLPVTKHWRTSAGIMPFSDIGYNIKNSILDDNLGRITYSYSGDGGLYQLYWGNAFKICKGLSIGLNVSYLFGSVYAYSNTEFEGNHFFNTAVNDAYSVDGIYLNAGIQYMFNIGEKHRLGLGAVYSNTAYIWAKEKLLVNSYSGTYIATTLYDTILYKDDLHGRLTIPQSIGGGISYTYDNKLTVAADLTWLNWKKFQFMKPSHDTLQNSLSASLGIQFTPDPTSNKFFRKMSFRAGGKYSSGELLLHNKPISEFGVCIGVGVPLTTFNTHSSINLLFEYGMTGTTANNLVQQDYFRFSFCFILQERWYQRVKID